MASDFFERQDVARRNTIRLVVLFALAVVAMIVSIDLLLAAALGYVGRDPQTGAIDWGLAGNAQVLGLATIGTLAVVGGGSLFKIAQLRAGGRVVAEQLGGRLVNSDTTVPSERQLLNIVEEMAIASGTPTPPVYLMEQEEGVNAFAAGFTPSDAVIGVTRGTVELLNRDELQGVIAHEFSHILNGDMRINIRLIGLLNGILIVGIIGYFILRAAAFSGGRHRRSSKDSSPAPLLALGIGLMAVGFFGTLFGNLMKAAVSRQREFLADASAVQFTRQPEGIAGALKKIGGTVAGSSIQSPNAPEASHMFFGRATSGFNALFSTHPPLTERIRRLDAAWDGTFPAVAAGAPRVQGRPTPAAAAGLVGANEIGRDAPPQMEGAVAQIGQVSEAHLRYAERLIEGLPAAIVRAAHEPYGARALVYTLLLDHRMEARRVQLQHLSEAADHGVYEETLKLIPLVERLDGAVRLPLLDMALPALRALTSAQYRLFKQNVAELVEADATIDLFEWALQRILLHELESHHSRLAFPRVRYRNMARLLPHGELLISVVAHAGHRDIAGARAAFEQASQHLGSPRARLRPVEECRLDALDSALSAIEQATPQLKRRVLQATAACISADRQITVTEAELVRAVAASLGCPMPPLIATSGPS